jgi:hypothetical protein
MDRCRQGPDRRADLLHVLGSGPAAAADEADAGSDEAPGVSRHVVRRAEVQVPAVDIARLAGIGHRREQRTGHRLGEPLDRVEHRRRADAAVDAEHVGAELDELRPELLDRGPIQRVAVLGGGQHRDDGHAAHRAHRADGGPELVHVAERLEDEEVHPALDQALRLLGEDGLGLVQPGLAPGFHTHAERPDRPGDPGRVAGGGAGDPRTG